MTPADRPNRFPLPPLMLVGTIALAWLLDRFLPLGWEADDVTNLMRGTGWALVGLAVLLDIWTIATLWRHETTVMPHKAASQLAVSGPFAFSRNPIYLGNVMIVFGLGFALGSRWFVLLSAVLFLLLQEFAIKREEAHLEANFPEAWARYKASVRRWV